MKKLYIALAMCAMTAVSAYARTPADCTRDPRCDMAGYYATKNPNGYVVHKESNHTGYLIAGAVIGVVLGYAIFGEPRDLTRASVRF